jgi:hypothetical protein
MQVQVVREVGQMGIVIRNDSDKDPNRQLNTPEGDVFEIDKRITDYLQGIKSEASRASMWNGREARIAARAAGLPPPPIDNTADIRAQVPEDMYPKVLVASNNKPFDDIDGGYGHGYIVSQAFRDAVETFDKGVHQFVPVEIRRKDGGLHDKRPFYILRVTRLLNTINVEASPELRRVSGKPTDPVTDETKFHLGSNRFAVFADRTKGIGLWRDIRSYTDLLASQRLIDLLEARGITGWCANSTFAEV